MQIWAILDSNFGNCVCCSQLCQVTFEWVHLNFFVLYQITPSKSWVPWWIVSLQPHSSCPINWWGTPWTWEQSELAKQSLSFWTANCCGIPSFNPRRFYNKWEVQKCQYSINYGEIIWRLEHLGRSKGLKLWLMNINPKFPKWQ